MEAEPLVVPLTVRINVEAGDGPAADLLAAQVAKMLTPEPGEVGCRVVKAADEQRYTLGLAYPSMRPDVAVAKDGHRDFAAPATLENAAWSYLAKSRQVGVGHADSTEGSGRVVESYIYRGPDWDCGGTIIKAGDWLLGVVWDEATWAEIRAGRLTGYSPQGTGRRTTPTPDRLSELRS